MQKYLATMALEGDEESLYTPYSFKNDNCVTHPFLFDCVTLDSFSCYITGRNKTILMRRDTYLEENEKNKNGVEWRYLLRILRPRPPICFFATTFTFRWVITIIFYTVPFLTLSSFIAFFLIGISNAGVALFEL